MNLLQVHNLIIQFQNSSETITAVNDISFQINHGEILGIVGESGSGKSMTALSIMGLIDTKKEIIKSGKILFEGTDLFRLKEQQMCHYRGTEIAMIFQEPMTSLNPLYICGEQVAEAIQHYTSLSKKDCKEKVIQLFKEVQLEEPEKIFTAYPHELSGGQRQRVLIAMALSGNPKLLIADEPTAALDVTLQKNILELLLKLKNERKMSMIMIAHDLSVVANMADRMMIMQEGNLIEEGLKSDILKAPTHTYTKALIACMPDMRRSLKKLPVITDFIDNPQMTADEIYRKLTLNPEEINQRKDILSKSQPILEIKNLKTHFPVKNTFPKPSKTFLTALDGISFKVFQGETLGIAGSNGSGKTTLGKNISRLIEPDSGEIIFNGIDLLKLKNQERRKFRGDIQIIFQDPYSSLNPRMTVGCAIGEALKIKYPSLKQNDQKEQVINLLEKVGLKTEYFNRFPHQLSGGQKQRVAIARSVAMNPQLIICDEIVSALDVSVQAQILNLFSELREQLNLTCIFISHDFSVLKHISDRILILNKGKIEEIGNTNDIYLHPKSDYTHKLIEAIPAIS